MLCFDFPLVSTGVILCIEDEDNNEISKDYRRCVDVGGGVGDYVAGTSYIRQPTWIRHIYFFGTTFSQEPVFFHDI